MESLRKAAAGIKLGVQSAKEMTVKELLGMMLGVCLVTFGNAGQLLAVNEWLTLFPAEASAPFTVLTITATSTTIFFCSCFLIWCAVKRPKVNYLWTRDCWLLSILIGCGNAGNGVLIVSATGFTPEILQAFLFSTTIFWTFILMKFANRDSRSYFSPLVIISFLFSLGGIVIGAASQFSSSSSSGGGGGGAVGSVSGSGSTTAGSGFFSDSSSDAASIMTQAAMTVAPPPPPAPKWWIAVFSAGMLMVAIYNVFAYRFMNKYATKGARIVSGLGRSNRSDRSQLSNGSFGQGARTLKNASFANQSFLRHQAKKKDFDDAITLKLAFLFASGITQTVWMWAFTMLDALPKFGSSANLHDVYSRMWVGYQCVFDASYCNNQNGLYAFLFAFCYVLNYFGTAYLNSYSAAVTSMVTQLSSPVVALVLLIIPKWNVSKQPVSVPESIVAIICLVIGAFLYTAWEESSRQEQEEAERAGLLGAMASDTDEEEESTSVQKA